MNSIIAFVIGSVPLLWWSRKSLLHPLSHGFPRFFAFESILVLVVLNAPHWFSNPFSVQQIVSWLLMTIAIVPVIWGVVLLHYRGESRPGPEGSPEYDWENTHHLIETGIYRYIRHPMYASLLFLAWGVFLKFISFATLLLTAIATLAIILTAMSEEVENIARFGEAYRNYMKKTCRFVPFLF